MKKSKFLAILLSVFQPGLGHYYVTGSLLLAFCFGVLGVTAYVLTTFVMAAFMPAFFILKYALLLIMFTVLGFDAARRSNNTSNQHASFIKAAVFSLPILSLYFGVAAFVETHVKTFKINSESMNPTLMPSDYILAFKINN